MSGEDRMEARFGPAGNAIAFSRQYKSSLDAPAWIAGLGLDCYEYQCGKGVHVGQVTAEKLGERARQAGIALSLHAPYFISLSNPDPEMRRKTVGYITTSCLAARWMGATRVVIHTGALLKRTRRQALDIAKETLRQAGRFHSHFSRIEFTPKGGEKCHRTFADHGGFGPDWQPLAAEIARRGWTPTFICESAGTQAEDARTMKDIYRAQRALYTGQGEEETT